MKKRISEKLLNKIMGWKTASDTNNEHPNLLALAAFGYDDYQQFKPGMRFRESLAIWLSKFPMNKRKAAYDFVKKRVLFITRSQMKHIVSTAYQDSVIPELLKQTSIDSKIPEWEIKKLFDSEDYKILHHQTLFMGLSDGSHIDEFRRSHFDINHEQVSRTHEISARRAEKIEEKLKERLKLYGKKNPKEYFRNIFLLDDFSASGTSYIKKNKGEKHGVKGKIGMFLDSITDPKDPISTLINLKDLHVYVILYCATETAVKNIQNLGEEKFDKIPFTVIPIQIIPDHIKFDENTEIDFAELVTNEKYGTENIIDDHQEEGNTDKPYLGFDGGALPLILYHNTPNNSLPILHRFDPRKTDFKGLFPRLSRHK